MNPDEKPRVILYSRIWSDAEKEIPQLLDQMEKPSIERLKQLPAEQLPSTEPRIRMLYFEAHYLTTLGFFNASIVISCILLEALLKEILYFRDKTTRDLHFGDAINMCKKRGYISGDEAEWLNEVRNNIRNWYVHSNIEKIAKSIGFRGWELDAARGKVEEKILFGNEVRAIYDIGKRELDTKLAIPFFLAVDEFT